MRVLATLFCLGVVAAAASADGLGDVTVGGDARSFAMGGAGVASLAGSTNGVRNNPAALAFDKKTFGIHYPNLGVRADGAITLGRALDYLSTLDSGSDAAKLARRFAEEDSAFGLNASVGVHFVGFEVLASGVAIARLLPNDALKQWAANGGNGDVPNNARADLLGAAVYTLPSVGYAVTVPGPQKEFDVAVGGRVKYMHSVYSHFIADADVLNDGTDALRAPEMGGRDTLTKNGVGADLGVALRSRKVPGLSGGFVVSNAIKPSFKFNGTDRTGAAKTYDLLATTASAGVGYEKNGTTVLADWVDITGAIGSSQLRAGVEQRLGGMLAIRGGYSSSGGYTWGFGLFGFDVAFGKKQPLEIVRTLRF